MATANAIVLTLAEASGELALSGAGVGEFDFQLGAA